MKDYNFYVYILTNWNNKVMYVGMTNNLERRMYEHKNKLVDGFTKKYNVNKLVYYEHGTDVHAAIAREKEIKKWRREKKNKLVMTMNPEWKDLSLGWNVVSTIASEEKSKSSLRRFLASLEMTKGHRNDKRPSKCQGIKRLELTETQKGKSNDKRFLPAPPEGRAQNLRLRGHPPAVCGLAQSRLHHP